MNAMSSKKLMNKSRGKNQTLLNGSSTASFNNKKSGFLDESNKTDKSSSEFNKKSDSQYSLGSEFLGDESQSKLEDNKVENGQRNYKTTI